ncbi:putative protein kinase [Legionella moravica]|uniref:Serine/threonine-protein kinase n=1 Tax=Legionella moravica TaxID=39962 RepID=A0A378JUX0_9GAMM|nr:serine/threonine-protein kinase [Legionella moravica]KTD31684.1 putative protein kinase [Legionella moravica]STX62236.1 serine/threonine-protein kinase [Legionella moravica]
MPILTVNPTLLSPEQMDVFIALLQRFPQKQVWEKETEHDLGQNYSLKLTHHIVQRDRKKESSGIRRTGYRYEILDNTALVKSRSTQIYPSYATLAVDNNHQTELKIKQPGKKRLVKIQDFILMSKSSHRASAFIEQEAIILETLPHLSGKPLVMKSPYTYTTMRQVPGKELYYSIEGDASKKTILTLEQRFDFSYAVLEAYVDQVLKPGWVHRDIKPENIIISMTQPPRAYFIDYGYAKPIGLYDGMDCGTAAYVAPEIFKGDEASTASDVYSLARVLALIWGDYVGHYCAPGNEREVNAFFKLHSGYFTYSRLFHNGTLPGLTEEEKTQIRTTLTKMSALKPSDRMVVTDALEVFNQMISRRSSHGPASAASSSVPDETAKEIPIQAPKSLIAIHEQLSGLKRKIHTVAESQNPDVADLLTFVYLALATETTALEQLFQEGSCSKELFDSYKARCALHIDSLHYKLSQSENDLLKKLTIRLDLLAGYINQAYTNYNLNLRIGFFDRVQQKEQPETIEQDLAQETSVPIISG